jgi:transketolase
MVNTKNLARNVRISAIKMVHRAKASHIASALSIVDILAVLYGQVMVYDNADEISPNRDRFILSKGHACVAVYAVLAEAGFLTQEQLETYGNDYSWLMNHISHKVSGVEFSSGSLGHGLPFGVGKAIAAKIRNEPWRTFVLLSDGEMDEGSNWEALMFAAHHRLSKLVAIIDYNKLQSMDTIAHTLGLEPLVEKLNAFGWQVHEVDGHDHKQLEVALSSSNSVKPTMIIAHTVKGKGVSFMENKIEWHYKNPSDAQLEQALIELNGVYDA